MHCKANLHRLISCCFLLARLESLSSVASKKTETIRGPPQFDSIRNLSATYSVKQRVFSQSRHSDWPAFSYYAAPSMKKYASSIKTLD